MKSNHQSKYRCKMDKTLHLGCGNRKIKDAIGLDILPLPSVDCVADMNAMPFKDNKFNEIFAYNVIEHSKDLMKTMSEIWRVGKNGCIVHINVPYYNSPDAFRDPTHRQFFTERTMEYFTDVSEYSYYSKIKFKTLKTTFDLSIIGKILPQRLRIPLAHIFGNIITAIQWDLEIIKS